MSEVSSRILSLQNKRVLVTRTQAQAGELSAKLLNEGAIPIELPVIRIVPPEDWQPLDRAMRELLTNNAYDWLLFTSANGVRMVLDRLQHLGYDPQSLRNTRIATIGPATAAALTSYQLTTSLVPQAYIAEGVIEALQMDARERDESLAGKHILIARAAEARQVLITELEREGMRVDVVAAYQTLPVAPEDERGHEVIKLLREQRLDFITFTSSSTVHHFMHWLSTAAPDITVLLASPDRGGACPRIASIGPITSQTARSYSLEVSVEAREFTTQGLVEALVNCEETHS